MTFGEHLEELRGRLVRAALAVLAGMIVAWVYRELLFGWLLRPLKIAWFCHGRSCSVGNVLGWMMHPAAFSHAQATAPALPAGAGFSTAPQMNFSDPTGAFVAYLKIAFVGGLILALPVVFYQLWAFIAPGLYAREKKMILPLVVASTAIFVAGSMFGYYLVFPVGYEYFLSFGGFVGNTGVELKPTLMMDLYLEFTTQMLLAFGVVFEIPLFLFFLSLIGVVTWRQLLSFGRYFTVIAFIIAAILTPTPDMYSQVMLGTPLVALYYIAVLMAYLFGPKEQKPWRSIVPLDGVKPPAPIAEPAPAGVSPKVKAMTEDDLRREAKIQAFEAQRQAKMQSPPKK